MNLSLPPPVHLRKGSFLPAPDWQPEKLPLPLPGRTGPGRPAGRGGAPREGGAPAALLPRPCAPAAGAARTAGTAGTAWWCGRCCAPSSWGRRAPGKAPSPLGLSSTSAWSTSPAATCWGITCRRRQVGAGTRVGMCARRRPPLLPSPSRRNGPHAAPRELRVTQLRSGKGHAPNTHSCSSPQEGRALP